MPLIHWTEHDLPCSADWRSERGLPPPKRVVLADDTMSADSAYQLVCEGTALLWRGDFQNARQMLQALGRRIDQPARRTQRKQAGRATATEPAQAFHLHRQAQSHRARLLGMLLLSFDGAYGLALRRAPDARLACTQAWGEATADTPPSVASMRELLGLISAHEWRKNGVAFSALGPAPSNRIHPHYGVFSPVRGEYVDLVAQAPLPGSASELIAFDIGVGTGVLSAVLARRGIAHITGTDQDARALVCAQENIHRLGLDSHVQLLQTHLFPSGTADLIVCNPPWLPARPGSPIEYAVYDPESQMLLGFLQGLRAHLTPKGEGWLILSDLAELLGLRSRAVLLQAIADAGLQLVGRLDAKPHHPKAHDTSDALHHARSRETTSLWRLSAVPR